MKIFRKCAAVFCAVAMMGSILSANAWAVDQSFSLQVNGENVALTDAAPEAKNGRTFIPVRAAFEALGAQVDWDQAAKSVTAVKGDTTVVMTMNSTVAKVTENGETKELTMDVVPYAKNGRVYVPVRFAAEALHCAVGWDGDARTVIIVDVPALLEGATFENLNGWMKAEAETAKIDNAITTGTADFKLTAPDENGVKQTYPLKVDFTSHATETKQQINLATDFTDLADLFISGMGTVPAAEKAEFLKLCQAEAEARMDLTTGKIYFTVDSPLLLELTQNAVGDSSIWYLLDMNKLMEQEGMSAFDYAAYVQEMQSTFSEDMSFEELLCELLTMEDLTDAEYDYEMLKLTADVCRDLFSDQAMTKSGNYYVVNWKMEEEGTVVQMKLTYQPQGNRLTGCTMEMSVEDGVSDPITMTMKVQENGAVTTLSIRSDLGDDISLDIALSAKTVEATTEPTVVPPAGAQVVDVLEELEDSPVDYGDLTA